MKVRVVDIYKSGFHWEFLPYGVQDISGHDSRQLKVPPLDVLVSATIAAQPSLKDVSQGVHPARDDHLVHEFHIPAPPPPPKGADDDDNGSDNPDRSFIAPPPGFEVQIEAPIPPQSALHTTISPPISNDFDYFTSTQLMPSADPTPHHDIQQGDLVTTHNGIRAVAWEAGLPVPFHHAAVVTTENAHAATTTPKTSNILQPRPPLDQNRNTHGHPKTTGFARKPEERTARRSKLSKLQAELSAILFGKDEDDPNESHDNHGTTAFQTAAAMTPTTMMTAPVVGPKKRARLNDDKEEDEEGEEDATRIQCMDRERAIPPTEQGPPCDLGNRPQKYVDKVDEDAEWDRKMEMEAKAAAAGGKVSFMSFKTGNGATMAVDPEKLAAAERLLADVVAVSDYDSDNADENRNRNQKNSAVENTMRDTSALIAPMAPSMPPSMPAVHGSIKTTTLVNSTLPARPSRFRPPGSVDKNNNSNTPSRYDDPNINNNNDNKNNRHAFQNTPSATSLLRQQASATVLKSRPILPLDSLAALDYVFLNHPDDSSSHSHVSIGWGVLRGRLLESGANPTYASEEWTRNHYRWIVWKLARCELAVETGGAKMPRYDSNHHPMTPSIEKKYMTSTAVERQLLHRYNREFTQGHRSWIKAVLHQDVSAGTLAVLMVASIRTGTMIELTDGWYWIMAQCDPVLSNLVSAGKITPGMKVRICGAHLVSPQGPGEPLDVARTATLHLSGNNVHPLPSTTNLKLGMQNYAKLTQIPISAIHPQGGTVPQTLIVVLRRYPRLLLTKLPSGIETFQTPRAHAIAEQRLQSEWATARSKALASVEEAELKRCKLLLSGQATNSLTSHMDRLYAMFVCSDDEQRSEFFHSLNPKDRDKLTAYRAQRQTELEEQARQLSKESLATDVPAALTAGSRECAMLLVGEIAHEHGNIGRGISHGLRQPATALITFWTPPEDFAASVKEGEVFSITGLEPKERNNQHLIIANHGTNLSINNLLFPDAVLQLDASYPRCMWRKIASSIADLPNTLSGHAMPRATPTLAGLPAMPTVSMGRRAATFDFTGLIIHAGPVYQDVHNLKYPYFQWIFLMDTSNVVDNASNQWLLAVHLRGERDAVAWLDGDSVLTHNQVTTLHDLELIGKDESSRVWRAAGGKHCAIVHHKKEALSASGPEAALYSWAADHAEGMLKALRQRIHALISS